MILSAPGKTFLVGEYLALDGGPSLLLTTSPRFSLRVEAASVAETSGARTLSHPFSPASPAGRLWDSYWNSSDPEEMNAARSLRISFHDPYAGLGGLGASSAQFALLYAAFEDAFMIRAPIEPSQVNWREVLTRYRACAWSGEGLAPSGADVVAQLVGGVTYFDGREFQAKRFDWRFPRLSFTLMRTGVKLATHEHLSDLGNMLPVEALRAIVLRTKTAFEQVDEVGLCRGITECANVLRESGLTTDRTIALIDRLRAQPWCHAVKGCGAMGADVVLIVHTREREAVVSDWIVGQGYAVCGSLATLGQGLETVK